MAASATAARMPPCTVPMGLPCAAVASRATTASPGEKDSSRMPRRVAAGGGGASPRTMRSMPSSSFAIPRSPRVGCVVGSSPPGIVLGPDPVVYAAKAQTTLGARVSLVVGTAAALVSSVVGGTLGLLSGFPWDRMGAVIMTVVDRDPVLPSALPRRRLHDRARPEPFHHHRGPRAHRAGTLHPRGAGRGTGPAREGLHGGGAGDGHEPAAHDPAAFAAQNCLSSRRGHGELISQLGADDRTRA